MDDAAKTMIENLKKNTGKSLKDWIDIVHQQKIEKHKAIIDFLKSEHGFSYGFANLVALKARGSDAGSAKNTDDLISLQYKGKEQFIPLFEKLLKLIQNFGDDVEFAPKKAYVSLRRKKQFGCLNPATKTRFEVGLNLKGVESKGILEDSKNSMFTHRINLKADTQEFSEVIIYLKEAYNKAN